MISIRTASLLLPSHEAASSSWSNEIEIISCSMLIALIIGTAIVVKKNWFGTAAM
jgi:hypothetical protein